ncbi:UNVERIFIED_CONTAM: hypothetical protein FKN15_029256 [Acipenser sinensis]
MGKKSRQQQKLQKQQLEDPANLCPWCSCCGKEDHHWRACPEGPQADWCGCCKEDGHNWAGCPYVLAQEEKQLPSQASAATPVTPVPPGSPSSREIWYWLVDAEGDLFKDLPLAINWLWCQDGEQWEVWERQHHPLSLHNSTTMVLRYLAEDMAEWVELPFSEPEGVELLSPEPEGEEPLSPELFALCIISEVTGNFKQTVSPYILPTFSPHILPTLSVDFSNH